MKEYIERAALLELYQIDAPENETGHVPLPVIRQNIMDMPAIDAVHVVRCAQCKHARESEDAFDWDGKTPLCECAYMTQPNRWHEYCSWGERKEDAHES